MRSARCAMAARSCAVPVVAGTRTACTTWMRIASPTAVGSRASMAGMRKAPRVRMTADLGDVRSASAFDDAFAREWDELLARSDADTVFMTSAWLRAWHETLGCNRPGAVVQIRCDQRLLAAAAFHEVDGIARFFGSGPSDYSDFVVDRTLDPTTRSEATDALLGAAA